MIYISGISSGLGKSILDYGEFASPISRHEINLNHINNNILIHCGINKDANSNNYVQDNFEFLHRIILSKPSHLILISTIDVYQKTKTNYSHLKLSTEHFIQSHSINYTILRLPMILSNYSRRHHLIKMFNNEKISLSGSSKFNYIGQDTIKSVLEEIISNQIYGTYDLVSKNTITLNYLKNQFKLNCDFGDYVYETPDEFNNIHVNFLNFQNDSETEIRKYFYK